MKKKYLIILLLTMFFMPFEVFAAGGFSVSNTSISMYPGESKTVTINTNNAVGKLNISSSNGGVASVSSGSIFIQNPGSSESITITGNSVGTATISVVASDNFATMDEEILAGQTKTITVNVVERPAPQPAPAPQPTPTPAPSQPSNSNPANNLSTNNNIKSLSVDGYKLVKVDDNNYTLSVTNDVTSVSINATLEDSKAKVDGIGTKELKVGENNFEIIVTSESGAQKKINIKITRKDGYYLEDLDSVLKNVKIQDADIIIKMDSKISKEDIEKIKGSKKVIRLNYYDENKKLIYSWIINGKEIKESKELVTSVTFTTENKKEIDRLSNYASGVYVNFKHNGDLPTGTKIKLYVGDKFENGSIVNVYHYNSSQKTLDFIKDNLSVLNGYIEFDIKNCSDYFVTMASIGNAIVEEESTSVNMFMILTIIELFIIIGLFILVFVKLRTVKRKDLGVDLEKQNENNVLDNNSDDLFEEMFDINVNDSSSQNNNVTVVEDNSINSFNNNANVIQNVNNLNVSNNQNGMQNLNNLNVNTTNNIGAINNKTPNQNSSNIIFSDVSSKINPINKKIQSINNSNVIFPNVDNNVNSINNNANGLQGSNNSNINSNMNNNLFQ